MRAIASLAGVCVNYGSRRHEHREGLTDINFALHSGEILGVVGTVGAGKTTLLKVISGEMSPDGGTALIERVPATSIAARRMSAYMPDPPIIPAELTGLEWLKYLASHRGKNPAERLTLIRRALEIGSVADFADRRNSSLSRGMVGQLSLAGASIAGSRLIVMDETLSGLDPLTLEQVHRSIQRLASEGRGVLVSSHDLAALERIATRVLVLHLGRLVADVPTAELLAQRVAEISVHGGSLATARETSKMFPRAGVTGTGISVPLEKGLTVENVLAVCRRNRIAVSGSKVRYRVLEDLLVEVAGRSLPN